MKIFVSLVFLVILTSIVTTNLMEVKIMPETVTSPSCNIYVVKNIDNKNIGDKNSSRGIAKSLKDKITLLGKCTTTILEYTVGEKESLEKAASADIKSIIISAGSYGIDFIESLSPSNHNFVIWSGHQIYTELKTISGKASIIAIPSYVMNDKVRETFAGENTKIIEVPGVAGDSDEAFLVGEYNKYPSLHNKEKAVIVFIGGNAPTEDGKIKEMTLGDAFNLGTAAATLALKNHAFVFATNSPRTTNEQLKEFEHGLAHAGLAQEQYHIFDFHSGERLYPALLYMASLSQNDVIVTGESSSMVRDSIEQAHKKIYVYLTSSMNDSHNKQIEYELKEGRVNIVSGESFDCLSYEYIPPTPITEMITQGVLEEINWEF